MPNYSMIYGVSEVARILRVDRDLIKKWAYTFSGYLSKEANPTKGDQRKFTLEDLRVFAYVQIESEDDSDIEAIKIGLDSNEHLAKVFDDLIKETTPIFKDVSTISEYTGHSVLFGGLAELGDLFQLAESYKLAGDKLIKTAVENEQGFELICPIIFNYRHALELYVKSTLAKKNQTHDLKGLVEKFKTSFEQDFNQQLPDWFIDTVLTFNDFDPNGTTFRYGGSIPGDEIIIDLNHLRLKMGWIGESFKRIREFISSPKIN